MLVMHKGHPFMPVIGQKDTKTVQEAAADDMQTESRPEDLASRGCSPDAHMQRKWHHNKHTSGMFSKHLKQVY